MSKVLFVDLDRTLIKTDVFRERIARGFLKNPLRVIYILLRYVFNIQKAKVYLEKFVNIPVDTLPYNHEVVKIIKEYQAQGKNTILATACDKITALEISKHLKLFSKVLSSTENINLKGKKKLDAIKKLAKGKSFDYIGDSYSDIPIWECAENRYVVSNNSKLKSRLSLLSGNVVEISSSSESLFVTLISQIRVHQWSKNLLLFFPVLFSIDNIIYEKVLELLIFFGVFSMVTSCTYIINDVLDLDSDRLHLKKKNRPLASGAIDPLTWLFSSLSVLFFCLVAGAIIFGFMGLVILSMYILLSLGYSLVLKTVSVLDLFLLSIFYVYRIIAGIFIWESDVSIWTLGFTFFFFFSLGCLKRWVEIATLDNKKRILTKAGKYSNKDDFLIFVSGISSAFLSNAIFLLYGVSKFSLISFASCFVFFFMSLLILFFLIKIWIDATKGVVGHDPVTYVLSTSWTQVWLIFFTVSLIFMGIIE